MKTKTLFIIPFLGLSLLFINTSCSEKEAEEKEMTAAVEMPDLAAIKSEIQAIETKWAEAQNTRNVDELMALYADDAVSMPDDAPTLTGKAAIRAAQEAQLAKNTSKNTIAFTTLEVYGMGNQVLEIGTSASTDPEGKVVETGKYFAFFEKRDGKYLCIREIYNSDSEDKD